MATLDAGIDKNGGPEKRIAGPACQDGGAEAAWAEETIQHIY